MNAIAGHTLYGKGGPFGNALLTNGPLVTVRSIDLSVSGREPRGGIDAEVAIVGKRIRVITTHLGLRAAERRSQVKRLRAALAEERSPLVALLGDINEWSPRARPLR